MAKQQPTSNTAQPDRPGLAARLRASTFGRIARWSKRTKIAMSMVVLLVVVHVVALFVWVPKYLTSKVQHLATLSMALKALDHQALMEAKAMANLLKPVELEPQERGGPSFILGAVAINEGELLPEGDRQGAFQKASRYLEEARVLGFPEGRRSQGLFLLGKALCLSGKYSASRTVLEEAINADSHADPETYNLLAIAYSQGTDANWSKAQKHSELYLAESSLTEEQRDAALLLNARILDHLDDRSGCQAALAKIHIGSADFSGAELLRAELLMREARALTDNSSTDDQAHNEVATTYQQAVEKLKEVQNRSGVPANVVLRAGYLLGLCELELGNTDAAGDQFRRVREQNLASAEGIAAAFQSATLLRRQARNEEAISLLRHVVQAVGDPTTYRNDLLSVDEVRKNLLSTYEQDLQSTQFEEAAQVSRLLQPLFPPQRELELTGDLLRATANTYLSKAVTASTDQAKVLSAKARSDLRRAGLAFAKLAEVHSTSRTYSDDLWNEAQCFFEGHDYEHAAVSLESYLKNELRRRRATALLLLGEARLTLGDTDKALLALHECIDSYASDPAIYQARLFASKANLEKGDTAKAEAMLRANLDGGKLTPHSAEWRDSLFALGSLLHIAGRYEDAIQRLEEAVERYPHAPQAIEARYLVADSYRHIGQHAQQKMQVETVEKLRLADANQMLRNMNAALEQYRQTQMMITNREKEASPDPLDRAILRNCYFAIGQSLYELNRFDDSIHAYADAANLCRNEPAALDAFVQMSNCYRQLNCPEQAHGTIVLAEATLARINKDANFTLTTNYTREEWSKVLHEMAEL
ncbi:MAG TPA: tetratricopeptide repeat protein [Pirellulales bacterium]|jgi:tetratricopeptide (TPR) repeat protein|nr:tetratricopeptide repeat protein [Pirellulales bacterium]